jgi:hypothetical protein
VLSGLQAVVGAAQGATSMLTGQNLPKTASSDAPSAQTSSASSQFASSTLASLISTQTNQNPGAANLQAHHHGHHHRGGGASGSTDSTSSSSISTNASVAAPTPTSDSASTGLTIGSLVQTAAQVALMI